MRIIILLTCSTPSFSELVFFKNDLDPMVLATFKITHSSFTSIIGLSSFCRKYGLSLGFRHN